MVVSSHDEMVKKALKKAGVRLAYDALEEEFQLLEKAVAARQRVKKTQEQIAKAMHTTTSAVGRLEIGRGNPTLSTLRRYAKAVGCRLEIKFIPI